MIRILSILIVCSLFLLDTNAQVDTVFSFKKSIQVKAAGLAVDNLENIYIVTVSDQLQKYDRYGDSASVYNQSKRFGKLHSIEVTNPLKILLFYKDFSTVVILDRFLSERSSIDLRKIDILQATAISLSFDNNIWIFDGVDNRLKKIDEQGNLMIQTEDLRGIFPKAIKPVKIINQNNIVYLYDPSEGIYLFDHFGSFQRKFPIKNWTNLNVIDQLIVGTIDNDFKTYNTSTLIEHSYRLPSSLQNFDHYIITNNSIYSISADSIHIYGYQF